MADGEVLKSFLVELGFDVKQDAWKKFQAGIAKSDKEVGKVDKSVATLAKSLKGLEAVFGVVAGGVGAELLFNSFEKITGSLTDLYWQSQRTGASVGNLKAYGYAASQTGASVQSYARAIDALSLAMASNPGNESLLKGLGVSTRGSNGQMRDTALILNDLTKRLGTMPKFVAIQYAAMLGLGDWPTLQALMRNQDIMAAHNKAFAKSIGLNLDDASKSATKFSIAQQQLHSDLDLVASKLMVDISPALIEFLKLLDDFVTQNPQLTEAIIGTTAVVVTLTGALIALGLAGAGLKTVGAGLAAIGIRGGGAAAGAAAAGGEAAAGAVAGGEAAAATGAGAAGAGVAAILGPLAGAALSLVPTQLGDSTRNAWVKAHPGRGGGGAGKGAAIEAFFRAHGYTAEQARGIASGLYAESKFDPHVKNKQGSSGYGLAQWLLPRQGDFSRYFGGLDIHNSTLAQQEQFLLHEMAGGMGRGVRGAGSAWDAGKAFIHDVESPGVKGEATDAVGRAYYLSHPGLGGGGVQMSQATTINVYGANDARAAGQQVAANQTRVNGDLVRNLKANLQ